MTQDFPGLVFTGLFYAGLLLCVVGMVAVVVILFVIAPLSDRRLAKALKQSVPKDLAASTIPPTAMQNCPTCGAAMAVDAIEGICPLCLFKGAISSAHEAAQSSSVEQTAPHDASSAPGVGELATQLPHLEILELIGQGGMGAVYKARQPSLDRLVAVKVLPPEAGRDPAFAERFNREARALARLGHPNIVGVHEIGQAGGHYYIVMEYVDGVNLRQLLRSGHLQPEQALRVIPQICDALQYAHEEGIVHRDVKPENILLDKKGRVKIADFGLAKLLGRDRDNFTLTLTGSRQVMGTLYYMAPEQVERPLEVDHRADIYSLGVVFYEMLTGQLPLGHFPLPSEKAGTDARLDGIVLHAMEREPERRYQQASDVKSDMEGTNRRSALMPPAPGDNTVLPSIERARERLQNPAAALVAIGFMSLILSTTGVGLMLLLVLTKQIGPEAAEQLIVTLMLLLAWLAQGSVLMMGALKMRRLESHNWAITSSILALLPTPLAVLGIPVGIYALAVLTARDVKAAFAEQSHSPT